MTLATDKNTTLTTDTTDAPDQITLRAQLHDYCSQGRLWVINAWDAYGDYATPFTDRLRAVKTLADATAPDRLLLIAALMIVVAYAIMIVDTVASVLVWATHTAAVAIAALACVRWLWQGWSWVDERLPKDNAD